jgi:FkbM family methyltransferase
MFTSYAQNFEDVMLWRALKDVGRGFYVDIGAQDPIVDSVSMGFYEKGWRGIHVEPVASYADLLRSQRPDELVVEAAVAAARGTLKLFEVPGTGLSSADAEIALRHSAAGFPMHEIEVACLTLDDVLAPHADKAIHWLKIDVEGYEREVLRGWTASARPWIVVVESTLPLTQSQTHERWAPLIAALGYRCAYFDGLNRFYLSSERMDLIDAFRHGPTVFDGFVLSGTASAPYCAKLNARIDELHRHGDAADLRAAEMAKNLDAAAERARSLEERIEAIEAGAAAEERRARDAETRARVAEDHVAAMRRTVSWRVTAPLRGLRRLASAPNPGRAGRSRGDIVRRVVSVAKRSGTYAQVAPWVRERFPGLWSRAKRMLLDDAPASAGSPQAVHDRSMRAPVRNYIPHSSTDRGLDAIGEIGSVSVSELQILLDRAVRRLRKE